MNLQDITAPLIAAVNPPITGQWLVSAGYSTSASGKRSPAYAAPVAVSMQVQALSGPDLRQLDGLNIQGTKRAVYLRGNVEGANRPDAKGGDLLVADSGADVPGHMRGKTWLVHVVLEAWDTGGWSKVAVTEQAA